MSDEYKELLDEGIEEETIERMVGEGWTLKQIRQYYHEEWGYFSG